MEAPLLQVSPPLFPVELHDVPSKLTFHDAPEREVALGSGTIRAGLVQHQGPTVGYRIEEEGRALVYMPDHEPSLGGGLQTSPPEWMSGHDIAQQADVLLHDAQYRDHEYPNHIGWGHSGIGDTVVFARKAEVDQVVLFHHDPYHTDDELDELLVEARRTWSGDAQRLQLAHEGMTITLEKEGVTLGP